MLAFFIAGCEVNPLSKSALQCQQGLELANKELSLAKANGFSGTIAFTKAAGLLAGASIQYEFGKYRNCNNKVERARRFIKHSQKKK